MGVMVGEEKMTNLSQQHQRCYECYMAYVQEIGGGFDNECGIFQQCMYLGILGRNRICGQLELLLQDLEKYKIGETNLIYPDIVKQIIEGE